MISFHTDMGDVAWFDDKPAKFRRYIEPTFKKLFTTSRKAGTHVYLFSDGCIPDIIDDLIDCGVSA